ncbi:CMP-N,N'-diacetyllegionaminic acid synthase [Pedobacter sp. UYP24]
MIKGTLILIPARAGSKGLPGKNVKILGNLPLIEHTLRFSLKIKSEIDVVCVSSNDEQVLTIARNYEGVDVPFERPAELASDHAGSYEVVMHALNFYEEQGVKFERLLLLQPTSPLRHIEDYNNIKESYTSVCDMVVSVSISKNNPYFNLFEEKNDGFLKKSKESNIIRRQDCPEVYAFNGSFYLINVNSLKRTNLHGFTKIIKSVMPEERSIDIDNRIDWKIAEYFLEEKVNENG